MTWKTKLGLSLFGVLLSIIGFYVSNASSFPLIQRLMAPSYVRAMRGIEHIQMHGSLQLGEADFGALASVVESRVAEMNTQIPRSAIVLERLEATGGGIAFGATTSRQTVGLNVFFRGRTEPLRWDLLELSKVVENAWKDRSVRWASWLFWLGLIQTIWPMLFEARPRSRSPAAGAPGIKLDHANSDRVAGADVSSPNNRMQLTALCAAVDADR